VAAFSSLSGASSKVISVLSAAGEARRISSSLRWVAACARDWVRWMTKTIASVVADASVWNTLSSLAGNPNTALKRTHARRLRPRRAQGWAVRSAVQNVEAVFVKVVEANGSYAAGSAGSNGGLIQAESGS
jgi:hypothetical protein